MRNEVNNWQYVGFFILTYTKNTQCVDFFTQTYKTKHDTDEAIPLARSQKNQHIMFQKVFLGWKLSPIIYKRGLE